MNNKIFPCLWFDGKAKEAAELYCSIFNNSKILVDSPMVVQFELEGSKLMGLNGGPMFTINPSISLFVTCATVEETERIWNKFLEGGSILMPMDNYPWSEKYGWITDKFGMSWQIMLGNDSAGGQKIVPAFLFTREQYGNAQKAVKEYVSLFPDSKILDMQLYEAGESQPEGTLKFGMFSLSNNYFIAMDGPGDHAFKFNEGVSIFVECDTQEEIDKYWNTLTAQGQESMCGWLKDNFGVSWQIVPRIINSLMSDPQRSKRVMAEIMKMKKLDIKTLENA